MNGNGFFEAINKSYNKAKSAKDLVEKEAMLNQNIPLKSTLPPYYNNSKGSLYKVATERGWNAYLFDLVKRLERGGKKDPLKQEIEKSIGVLRLWLKELEE